MSPASAYLVHCSRGRLRVRVPDHRGDREWLAKAQATLAAAPGVTEVQVGERTGSLLVLGPDDADVILEQAARTGVFELVEPRGTPTVDRLVRHLGLVRQALTTPGHGRKPMAFTTVALFGASLYQLSRGKFLPAGEALLLQALNLMKQLDEEEASLREERPSSS